MQKNEKSLKDQYIEMQQRAFIREVDEEVRAEKVAIIWNKYKYYIITAIVIILAITIGHTTYENNKRETSLKQAEVFEHIMSNPSISVEGRILELKDFASKAKYGYRDIAYFNIYSMQVETNKISDAINTLKTIISSATDSSFKDLAILKLSTINYSKPDVSAEDKSEIIKLLSQISARQPFYFSAQYILGTIYISGNNPNLAKTTFERIVENENAPVGIKSQSLNMLNYIKSLTAK